MTPDPGPTEADNYLAPLDAKISQFKEIFVKVDREMKLKEEDPTSM